MLIHDLYRKTADLFRPSSAEVEGTIEELRVVRDGDRERWLVRLDARRDALFVFEPSAISRPRKEGQRVRIGYALAPATADRLRADWIEAA
jgi:hypothetical protein